MVQVAETGEGYRYIRDRSCGCDVTVYLHQLAALRKGYSVSEVFDDDTEVHHRVPCPLLNLPENVEVLTKEEHDELHDRTGRCALP